MRRRRVVLYTRPGCHLCEVARDVIVAEGAGGSFDLAEVNIETDEALEREYGIRIPVVEIDGVETFEVQVDLVELRRLLSPA
jgi:glutaredoxin